MNAKHAQTLALAGCYQALIEVDHLARTGKWDREHAEPLIRSLYVFSPDKVQDIISVDDCQPGLSYMHRNLKASITGDTKRLMQYLIMLQNLERKLQKDPNKLSRIRQRLDQLEREAREDWLNNSHMQRLGGLYQETVSTLPRRIMIQGDVNHLGNDLTAARIRALLLACLRLLMLWQQKGGRRWQMVFTHKTYNQIASELRH